ncbi:MAG: hypothetical protein GXO29_07015 [Thermotogae bacterium]|nr:hypothetical protein [Thermotogota bacterium]
MWYLLVEPIIYNRWNGETGFGDALGSYFSYASFRGEWIISSHGVSLHFYAPFVFPLGQRFSLSDMSVGLGFVFADINRVDFSLSFPTGFFSGKYPGINVAFTRRVLKDSSNALYFRGDWHFIAASDKDERAFYNKFIDRHAYNHVSLEGAYVRMVGETAFLKAALPVDYAQSMNQFWMGLRLGGGLHPFVEADITVWPTKPRPHTFLLRLTLLLPVGE